MRIGLFTNFYLIFIVLVLSMIILLSSHALSTLDEITKAERQKHRSLQLANELFQSSENVTQTARTYVITGDATYERFFFEILDIRNGKRPRPQNYPITYWDENRSASPDVLSNPIALIDLMRREGFSERELDLLQQSQKKFGSSGEP